jgi:hypothetical protein
MKQSKKLLAERAKCATEIERVNGLQAQAEKDKSKLEEVTLEDLSASATGNYEALKLKIAACRNSRKKLEARIEEIDAELGREYLAEKERAHAQLAADDAAGINRLIDGVLPVCDGDVTKAADFAKKTFHLTPTYARNRIVTNAFSGEMVVYLRTGMNAPTGPIHELAERVIAAEARQRRA